MKKNLLSVGFEPVTVRCLKNEKKLAKMNAALWHRAITLTFKMKCLELKKYFSKGVLVTNTPCSE